MRALASTSGTPRRGAGAKQIRPDLRLQDDGQARPHALQETPHRAGQVQRQHSAPRCPMPANKARARASPAAVVAVTSSGSCASRARSAATSTAAACTSPTEAACSHTGAGSGAPSPKRCAEAAPDPGLAPAAPQQGRQIERREQVGGEPEKHEDWRRYPAGCSGAAATAGSCW